MKKIYSNCEVVYKLWLNFHKAQFKTFKPLLFGRRSGMIQLDYCRCFM